MPELSLAALIAGIGTLFLLVAFVVSGRRWLHLLASLGFTCIFIGAWVPEFHIVHFAVIALALVNLVQFARLSHRLHQGAMTAEERALIAEVLAIEEPARQRRLREVITWRDAETGEVLMRQGQKAPPLIYIGTGRMEIEHEGLPVSSCGPDDFLGEMSLVTGEGASATVKVSLPARIAVFDRDGLLRLMDAMPELARAFDRRLNIGLVDKIQRMNRAMNTTGAGR
jgi:CRP-like cAMP-binding protein